MRKYDKEKDERIKQSVIEATNEIGVVSLTTAKIAKEANVSPATLYLRYENKEDLISRIYEEVKADLHDGLNDVIDEEMPLTEQIRQMIKYSIKRTKQFPKETNFIRQVMSNPALLDEHAQHFVSKRDDVVSLLLERLDASDDFSYPNRTSVETLLGFPAQVFEQNPNQSEEISDELATMVISAIYKGE
ncbi:TetR/AcrR family transcriptional regulator [Fructobacillus sp. M2-14]|uniref:TetR/AcrR family transcriptional regulator n=1 Tax=Fructobacillus broussonetiae TaxID=2713173 RepID=A0ABS5QY80_9LACO|nr:TetR/AcrR family transcriptional regulator [Fructobacillus broussonetiae]MBS9338163.1 TetR/AcrR family transcriptional regulator [Fructobacillus broussonetiae]